MKKKVRKGIIIGIVSTLICSIGIGIFVQKNNTLKLSKEDIGEKQAMTETKEFTEDDFPYNIKFKDIAVGYHFAVALDEEGYLWTWGRDGDTNRDRWRLGTLGSGSTEYYRVYPKRITKNKYSKICAKEYTAFAIDEEGYLYGWGYNNNQQLGNTNETVTSPLPIKSNLYFSTVTTAGQNMAAIDENGEIWVCGRFADSPETGKRYIDLTNISSKTNTKFIDVATTDTSLAAIDENGNIWTWGYNGGTSLYATDEDRDNYGLLGNNKETVGREFVELTKVTTDIVYTEIDAGTQHIIAKDNNKHLWSWGKNDSGELGQGNLNIYGVPTLITNKRTFNEFYTSNDACIAIDTNKDVWAWGNNSQRQFGGSSNKLLTSMTKLDSGHKYIKCAISTYASLILDEKGVLYGAIGGFR